MRRLRHSHISPLPAAAVHAVSRCLNVLMCWAALAPRLLIATCAPPRPCSPGAAAGEVVEILSDSLTLSETPIPLKIARLFLASDILHNTSSGVRNASRYRRCGPARTPPASRLCCGLVARRAARLARPPSLAAPRGLLEGKARRATPAAPVAAQPGVGRLPPCAPTPRPAWLPAAALCPCSRLEEALPDIFESLQEAYRGAEGRMAQELLRRYVLKVGGWGRAMPARAREVQGGGGWRCVCVCVGSGGGWAGVRFTSRKAHAVPRHCKQEKRYKHAAQHVWTPMPGGGQAWHRRAPAHAPLPQVLRVWRGWFIFSDDYLNGLQVGGGLPRCAVLRCAALCCAGPALRRPTQGTCFRRLAQHCQPARDLPAGWAQ